MSHPFIPVPNVASVELIYTLNGVVMENVFHVQKGSPFTLAQLQALRGTVNTWESSFFTGFRSSQSQLSRIRTKALDSAGSPTEDFFLPTPRPGANVTTALPGNVTWSVKLATGLAGRSFRGRWYVIGLATNQLGATSNQINVPTGNSIVSSLNSLLSALAGAGYTLGVVSYRTGGAYRTTGLFTTALSWTPVNYDLDSMRRRLTGRGI